MALDAGWFMDDEFRSLYRRKSTHTLELRQRNVRFIGEMVKFGATPPSLAFGCLKAMTRGFSRRSIEIDRSVGRPIFLFEIEESRSDV